ncbi:MAG TPA: HNH nuclease family protein [Deltaproteobacteria bacterium]|nr:HNH nuclease family protein [Deltaproteobacteria bacterium]
MRIAMSSKQTTSDRGSRSRIVDEARQSRADREKGYRERALKIFPRICARCGREFSGRKLRELTVHHKDHDHDNNPPDGSNWELLCLYCHDNEHSRDQVSDWYGETTPDTDIKPEALDNPFADLANLLKNKK